MDTLCHWVNSSDILKDQHTFIITVQHWTAWRWRWRYFDPL